MSRKKRGSTETHRQQNALIIHPDIFKKTSEHVIERNIGEVIEEAEGLARAIELDVIHTETIKVSKIQAGSFLGTGQRENVKALIDHYDPDIVIFNGTLSPIQQRNLEREWKAKVIDRTALILEIFGARAQTKEGRLQVDLAALEYQKSRLVRSWTHLERQRGGAGFMGGPGETQIEIDRRLINNRITKLKKELETVKRTRDLGRLARERVPFPIIALVGYTNAGKSTLFNYLTNADVFAEDLPFATLDPTMRQIILPQGQKAILSDTVGFIADLPTQLVAAFRSTLEQVNYADVILHVIDVAREDYDAQRQNVIAILKELGVEYDEDPRIIEVLNKVDAIEQGDEPSIVIKARRKDNNLYSASAITGEGLPKLLDAASDILNAQSSLVDLALPYSEGKALSWLHEHGHITAKTQQQDYVAVSVQLSDTLYQKFFAQFPHLQTGTQS